MIDHGIMVHWTYSDEYIELDIDAPASIRPVTETREWWRRERAWVRYTTESKVVRNTSGSIDLIISYTSENNRHLIEHDIPWGVSTIRIVPGKVAGKAVWKERDDTTSNVAAHWERVAPGLRKLENTRQHVSRIEREQQKFRSALLLEEPCCALTGERTVNALEAAHIIPAKERGVEKISNGVLLRADLHRLYDCDAFRLGLDGKVVQQVGLSDQYRTLLSNARLDPRSTARVRAALQIRWEEAKPK